jgi:hypothetical protein
VDDRDACPLCPQVVSVDSSGVSWPSPEAYAQRLQHERAGRDRILALSRRVTTLQAFNAYLLLGGHQVRGAGGHSSPL